MMINYFYRLFATLLSFNLKCTGTKLGATCQGSIELHWMAMLGTLVEVEE